MSDGPGRFSDQFNLRLPDGMRDRLKAEAEANKRSMNAEIVARLEQSMIEVSRGGVRRTRQDFVDDNVREAAAAAMLVVIDALTKATKAFASGGLAGAAEVFAEVNAKLHRAIGSHNPFYALMSMRNQIVHPVPDKRAASE